LNPSRVCESCYGPTSYLVFRVKTSLFFSYLASTKILPLQPSHKIHRTMHCSLSLLAIAGLASAYIGELCGGPYVGYGTCEETTSWCKPSGGESPSGYCTSDPDPIRCCIYPICYNEEYYNGKCVDTSKYNCASTGGYLQAGLCPGPNNYEVSWDGKRNELCLSGVVLYHRD
jgi:hypothetical protein